MGPKERPGTIACPSCQIADCSREYEYKIPQPRHGVSLLPLQILGHAMKVYSKSSFFPLFFAVIILTGSAKAQGNRFYNFEALELSSSELRVTVAYTYDGQAGSNNVFIHATPEEAGRIWDPRITFVEEAPLQIGDHIVTLKIEKRPNSRDFSTVGINVCMSVFSKAFHCEVFSHDKAWSAVGEDSDPSAGAGPALRRRVEPYQPSSNDSVRFIVEGSHPTGVRQITIYVNGKPIRTCSSRVCEATGGPYPAGTMRWRASAVAGNGHINEGSEARVVISSAAPVLAACTISGAATGPSSNHADIFIVFLYGPNNDNRLRAEQRIRSRQFQFRNLPDGRYRLWTDTRGESLIRVTPPTRWVHCRGGPLTGVDFHFR